MDRLWIDIVLAAGVFGWVFCLANARVFIVWRGMAPFAALYLFAILLVGLGMLELRFWTGADLDRVSLGIALFPVLAWPVRKRVEVPLSVRGITQ